MRGMRRLAFSGLLLVSLVGCATPSAPPEPPREVHTQATPQVALRESLALMMERGYVITQADGSLGRIDAALGRYPGYRVEIRVTQDSGGGSRIAVQALGGGRALPGNVVEPLLVDLQSRLGRENPL
ncbi:hypothetical protein [Halomonas binhaiensis]|uniref:DUF3568 family protein n=1 Tax=Halomonas binhaiensis TaxID=2562282 RepID=A0A5C1NBR9_9GAMM|nr:hypothetical protein [Halomonas binhaiensis]QEM80390.1 hypothetical protein E4T21_01580 [Halomonas binhaiensis]